MAQQQGSYNQFGQYGQVPGQPQQSRFPSFGGGQGGYRQQQYPTGTFQAPGLGGGQSSASAGTNTSDLSTTPPTGDKAPSATPGAQTTSTSAPPPVTSGAAGQQAPDTNPQYPPGTFQQQAPSGGLSQSSTGPVNMNLGAFGAPGAWDGGYNATFAPPPAPTPAPAPAPSAAPPAPQATTTPAVAPAPTAAPQSTGVPYQTWDSNAGPVGPDGRHVGAMVTAYATPGTASYSANQQQFTTNNQGYGGSGYWGNAAQVAAQQAEHAQANSIPLGVLGTTFGIGGADYGGQQNAGNSLNGLNGARSWVGSTYGLPYPAGTFR